MTASISHRTSATNTETRQKNDSSAKSTDVMAPLQVVADRMDAFKRREKAFNDAGWSFWPLADESFLAVHRKWSLSKVCPDLRAADALLKRIGGVA